MGERLNAGFVVQLNQVRILPVASLCEQVRQISQSCSVEIRPVKIIALGTAVFPKDFA